MLPIKELLPLLVAPAMLMVFSLVSAYVLKFGVSRTGISFDYVLFSIYVILALVLGGAI